MLFASYSFLLIFLPATLLAYWLVPRIGVLILASLIFYGAWNPPYVLLLIASFCFNYFMGWTICWDPERLDMTRFRRIMLTTGIVGNLGILAFYKYVPAMTGSGLLLPLGISFFTFTQIGYLVDCLDKRWRDLSFPDFVFFVTFFPHLIAGPIIHVREIIPQLRGMALTADSLTYGLTYFVLGLSKKVLLADIIAPTGIHSTADLLRYALQLYWDFSGYSDMAIGLAAMFGLDFPLNFDSPYKATSIIDFWQRWHMTLTRYLRLLLFNPMALALARRGFGDAWLLLPIVITMAIAGAWHGAGLAFLVWGLIHALFLIVNHVWRLWRLELPSVVCVGLTHACVLGALVLFRAGSLGEAWVDFAALRNPGDGWPMIAAGYAIVWGLPNTQEIMKGLAVGRWAEAAIGGLALVNLVALSSDTTRAFLYFQF